MILKIILMELWCKKSFPDNITTEKNLKNKWDGSSE